MFAATVNGCWNGDPNYPVWGNPDGGNAFVDYIDLSSAYQEENRVFVITITVAGKGYRTGEVVRRNQIKFVIEGNHRVWASPKIMFDPDSDYNEGDPWHAYRKLFLILDEEIGIKR